MPELIKFDQPQAYRGENVGPTLKTPLEGVS